ncbi:hypothetical protein LBMAG53_26220 [Planctomycetota bacterium]|nr:hypothetical protein LBMAG53_26220 [Planctomycetota bacterium]
MAAPSAHRWHLYRLGGLDQARVANADDYRNLGNLDQKLWVSLACPVHGLEFDERTLALIDSDQDGRVRPPELIAAVAWACERLRDPGVLTAGSPTLPLAAIDASRPAGATVLAAAKRILDNLGTPEATSITLAEVTDTKRIFAHVARNGDGIITAGSLAATPSAAAIVADAIACLGPVDDRSGGAGVNSATLDGFLAACTAHAAWHDRGAAVSFLGARTASAVAAVQAIRAKIDDWFTRAQLAVFDPRLSAAADRTLGDGDPLAGLLAVDTPAVVNLPLRRITADGLLDLSGGINPAWAGAATRLLSDAWVPLHGAAPIDPVRWRGLCAQVDAWRAWQDEPAGPASPVARLDIERIRAVLADGPAVADVRTAIAADLAVANEVTAIVEVERLVRYHRDLGILVRNFVNFADFYDPGKPAVFQSGSLYLDQRRFDLCVAVADPVAHAGLASLSRCFLVYCKCMRAGSPPRFLAVAATQGDGAYLMVGRNGVFYDRQGSDWDATVVKVVEAPISVAEAFISPYLKFLRLVEEQFSQRAGAIGSGAEQKLLAAATTLPAAPVPGQTPTKIDVGTVAAFGVAFGALATFLGSLFATLVGLGPWLPIGLAGIILAISGPSMLIAWFKLRQRTLGPILEAAGWAINGRVKINLKLGRSLTATAAPPKSATRSLIDPFADPSSMWQAWTVRAVILVAVLVIVWYLLAALHGPGDGEGPPPPPPPPSSV